MVTETKTVMMPRELTAANGGKCLMIGEFYETLAQECLACDGTGIYTNDDSETENCGYCNGSGEIAHKVLVSWTTIKAIYKKAVEHFGT